MSDHHLIRLRLGTETDWPTAFETILRRPAVRPVLPASRNVVIDRLTYWTTAEPDRCASTGVRGATRYVPTRLDIAVRHLRMLVFDQFGSTDAERGPRMDHTSPVRLPWRGDGRTSEQLGGGRMQQLSGVDTSFLSMETRSTYGHICNVVVLEEAHDGAGLTLDAVRRLVEQRMHLLPAFRNRLVEVPFGLDRPYWIVDPDFDLDYHLRELALPAPGSDAQLRAQVARIAERPLDRARPLWEIYLITGLSDRRAVLLLKFHHAAVDGVAGREILTTLLDTAPEPRDVPPSPPVEPEPVPSDAEVLMRSVTSLASSPVRLMRLQRRMWSNLPNALHLARTQTQNVDVTRWLNRGSRPRDGALLAPPALLAPRTSFNRRIGPHRRWVFGTAPLAEVKALKKAAGVTVNDVVMAMCAGALRRWLQGRDELPDQPLLVAVPISVRTEEQRGALGNRVSSLIAAIPTDEPDPATRLQRTHEAMRVAKEQHAAIGADVLADFTQFAMPAMAARAARVAASMRLADYVNPPFNLVISNVPGSQQPLYLAGARLLHTYPVSTITDGLGLNITVQSYLGNLDFGLIADRDLVPDLSTLMDHILEELVVLKAAHPEG